MTMNDDTPTVELPGDVHWLDTCFPMDQQHHHISPYLLDGPTDRCLLRRIDGSPRPTHRADRSTPGPAGSTRRSSATTTCHTVSNARAVSRDVGVRPVHVVQRNVGEPGNARNGPSTGCMHDETREICGRTFTFRGRRSSTRPTRWVYDHDAKAMFTGDMGHYHESTDCRTVVDGAAEPVSVDAIRAYNEDALPFVKFLDPEKMRDAFAETGRRTTSRYGRPSTVTRSSGTAPSRRTTSGTSRRSRRPTTPPGREQRRTPDDASAEVVSADEVEFDVETDVLIAGAGGAGSRRRSPPARTRT